MIDDIKTFSCLHVFSSAFVHPYEALMHFFQISKECCHV